MLDAALEIPQNFPLNLLGCSKDAQNASKKTPIKDFTAKSTKMTPKHAKMLAYVTVNIWFDGGLFTFVYGPIDGERLWEQEHWHLALKFNGLAC